MKTYQEIEKDINRVKEYNQYAGSELHSQLHAAANSEWSTPDLTKLIKSDFDVADKYNSIDNKDHAEMRKIQDSIIELFGN